MFIKNFFLVQKQRSDAAQGISLVDQELEVVGFKPYTGQLAGTYIHNSTSWKYLVKTPSFGF